MKEKRERNYKQQSQRISPRAKLEQQEESLFVLEVQGK
jgi:hypothetical protein